MQYLRELYLYFQRSLNSRRLFFDQSRREIRASNLILLRWGSGASLVLLTFFCFATPFILPQWQLSWLYLWYYPLGLGFFIFSCSSLSPARPAPRRTNEVCVLFCLVLLGYLITLDVFINPLSRGLFIPLFLVVIPILFVLPLRVLLALILLGQGAFAALSFYWKPESIARLDLFSSLVGTSFALFISWSISTLRVSDGNAMASYQRLSRIDSLTGILNKSACEQAIRRYLQVRPATSPCALLIIDLDNFKLVNDRLGHQAGDQLLEAMGQTLSRLFRSSDLFGRFGGDEFLVLLRALPDSEVVHRKCEQIQVEAASLLWSQAHLRVSCSIGAAYCAEERPGFEELFRLADDALYEAKAFGKSQHVLHIYQKPAAGKRPLLIVADPADCARLAALAEGSVIQAHDKVQALSCLSQYGPQLSLFVLDLSLPELDSFGVLRYLRSRPALRNLRVLAIADDPSLSARALELGADDLILRPIDPEQVRRQLRRAYPD